VNEQTREEKKMTKALLKNCSADIISFVSERTPAPSTFTFKEVVLKIFLSGLNVPMYILNGQLSCWCQEEEMWFDVAGPNGNDLVIFYDSFVSVENESCVVRFNSKILLQEADCGDIEEPDCNPEVKEPLETVLRKIFDCYRAYSVTFPDKVTVVEVEVNNKGLYSDDEDYDNGVRIISENFFKSREQAIKQMNEIGKKFGLSVKE
jgi:hypothetical protein